MTYLVTQRTREIGIRMALGASARTVVGMVVGRGMVLTLIAIALGLAGAAALTRSLATLLFGVGPLDPTTFVAAAAVLGAVALLASYLPARRAARSIRVALGRRNFSPIAAARPATPRHPWPNSVRQLLSALSSSSSSPGRGRRPSSLAVSCPRQTDADEYTRTSCSCPHGAIPHLYESRPPRPAESIQPDRQGTCPEERGRDRLTRELWTSGSSACGSPRQALAAATRQRYTRGRSAAGPRRRRCAVIEKTTRTKSYLGTRSDRVSRLSASSNSWAARGYALVACKARPVSATGRPHRGHFIILFRRGRVVIKGRPLR